MSDKRHVRMRLFLWQNEKANITPHVSIKVNGGGRAISFWPVIPANIIRGGSSKNSHSNSSCTNTYGCHRRISGSSSSLRHTEKIVTYVNQATITSIWTTQYSESILPLGAKKSGPQQALHKGDCNGHVHKTAILEGVADIPIVIDP